MAQRNDAKLPLGFKLIVGALGIILIGFVWLVLQATVVIWADDVLQPARSAGKLCFFDNAPEQAESLMNQASRARAAGNEALAQALALKGDDLIDEASEHPHKMLPYRDIHTPYPDETSRATISLLRAKIASYRNQCFILSFFN